MRVPHEFQRPIKVAYPDGNQPIFEEWLINNVGQYQSDREYLPINWTGFYVNNRYGANRQAMFHLDKFLRTLPRNKKYWTVTQYDLGIISNIGGLDIKIFGSGGGRIDFPIPLVCQSHGKIESEKRDLFANFIGSKTHPIREKLTAYQSHHDWAISFGNVPNSVFCNTLARSTFTLCPRGYGLTSFRIGEALEQGSIPVYISDEWIVPGNIDFNTYGVLIHSEEVGEIDTILYNISKEEIDAKRHKGQEIHNRIFKYEGLRNLILENL